MKKATLIFASFLWIFVVHSQSFNSKTDIHGNTLPAVFGSEQISLPSVSESGNEWTPFGPFGGDVLDVAIDPTNPQKAFVAADYPYIRNSEDEAWEVIENLLTLSPGGIHCIEANNNGTIFAGGNYSYYGIFRSNDGGSSWQQQSFPVTAGVLNIIVDPTVPETIYVVTSSNISGSQNKVILRSEDEGDSWTAFDMTSILPVGWACADLAVDPDNNQTLFALGDEGISNAKAIASFDGGATWSDVTTGLPINKPFNEVTIANGTVYICGGQLFGGNYLGIYKSEDFGNTWEEFSTGFPINVVNDIIIHPDDALKIYAATEGDGVYFTFNGGITWNYDTGGAGDNGSARKLLFHPEDPSKIYAGFLSLGICISENSGNEWTASSVGIASLALNDIEIDPNDPGIVLASFEAENSGGCYLHKEDEWSLIESLPGTRFSSVSIGIDGTMYAWSNGPTTVAAEGVYKSTDGGENWDNMGPNIGSVFETQIFAMDLSTTNPDLILIAGNNFGANGWASMIYRSTDGGENWENVFMGPENDGFKYIFIDPSSNDMTVYAAYKSESPGAGFLKSIDGGTNWLPINTGVVPETKWGGAIICDPNNPDVLYGGAGGYGGTSGFVYKSENGGSSWTLMNIVTTNYCKITDLLISPMNPDVIYAATSNDGIFLTIDDNLWEENNEGMLAYNITGFSRVFETEDETYGFYASTFTNSSYSTEVYDPSSSGIAPSNKEEDLIRVFPNPSNGLVHIDLKNFSTKSPSVNIYSLDGSRIIKNNQVINSSVKVQLNPGIYMLELKTGQETYTKKVIVY